MNARWPILLLPGALGCMTEDGPVGPPKSCVKTCTAPADCVPLVHTGRDDEDNWACNAGLCEYAGCTSAIECSNGLMSHLCEQRPGDSVPRCYDKCTSVQDCVSDDGYALYDDDNYACRMAGCEWLGCQSDAECQTPLTGGPEFVCEAPPGETVAACVRSCQSAKDCRTGAPMGDERHWACIDARCVHLGCLDDADCEASNAGDGWSCR